METAQIIRPAKKIKVVGCANCPYMDFTTENGQTTSKCKHPSFYVKYPALVNCPNIEQAYDFAHFGANEHRTPDWCPLENDVEAVVITNPVSGFNTKEEKEA